MIVIKKYGNRRLYDSSTSAYVTLEELAAKLRAGAEVKVIDAKSGRDLTQQTLAQIILEGRGAARLLPTPLLIRLIRLGDDALAEFFGTYVSWALGVYLQVRRGAAAVAGLNPLANLLFQGPLTKLYDAFKKALIHDLETDGFADTYAQTITYGLLTAAISRTEMSEGRHGTALLASDLAEMVPVTNPFLKEMLQTFLEAGGRNGLLE